MAKRDILKEAIADAKTVKETAIANAKAALEEAFTPRLKEMLATKLEEMDLDEEEEIKKEEMKSDRRDPNPEEKRERKMVKKIKDDSMEEEINLDEILAEIELDEEDKDKIKEDEASDKEEEGYIDGEEDADEDKDEEELDLDDMSDDDLKGFIEDVIADMVASGDLEAGENFEEEDEDEMEMVDDEEIVDVEVSEEMKDDKRKVDEVTGMPTSNVARGDNKFDAMSNEELAKYFADKLKSGAKGVKDKIMSVFTEELDEVAGMPTSNVARGDNKFDKMSNAELAKYFMDKLKAGGEKFKDKLTSIVSEINEEEKEYMEEELAEAYSTIETLKSDLNEVNLLNAKLLYTNKIFKAKTLTESQKVKVLGAFDKAGTVKETKLVFETLNEGLKTKKTSMIKESLGSASRVSRSVNAKKPIIETDPMVERFKKLAGIK
jgi:spore coat protein CotF